MGVKNTHEGAVVVILVRVLVSTARASMSYLEAVIASAELADSALDRYRPGQYDPVLRASGGDALVKRYYSRWTEKPVTLRKGQRLPQSVRPRCGAKMDTHPGACQAPCAYLASGVLSNRCRKHGSESTGPRTEEGKKRVADAQRLRWAKYREGKQRFQLAGDDAGTKKFKLG